MRIAEVRIMLEVKSITKRYGRITAVSGVSFCCHRNETVGLLGVNGAGKTTLLNIVSGCMPPTSGSVLIAGEDLMKQPTLCRRNLGYLPERPPLYDEMTVEEYLAFVCRLREVVGRDIPNHVRNIMELCSLTDVKKRLLGHLSKGYRQRAGIAQALCGDPSLLILDEPTVGLDPVQTVEMRELIRKLGEDHTILFSSHNLSEVQSLCHRICIVHHGRILKEDTLKGKHGEGERVILFSAMGDYDTVLKTVRELPELKRLNLKPVNHDGFVEGEATVADGKDSEIRLFRLMAAKDLPLRYLSPREDSLESVFLHATQEAGEI